METQEAIAIVFNNHPEKLFRVDILRNEVSKITGGIPDDFSDELRAFKDNPNNEVCMVWVYNSIRYIKSKLTCWQSLHNAYQNKKILKAKKRMKVQTL